MEFLIEDEQKEQITEIINFLKSDSGKLLITMIEETKKSRVNELIYANKEDIFNCQGEVRAYSDILNLMSEETLLIIRQ